MGSGQKKSYFYAVRRGRNPGVYDSWDQCQGNTNGFQGAVYKKFATKEEAELFTVNGSYDYHSAPSHSAPSRSETSSSAPSHSAPSHSAPSRSEPSYSAPSYSAPSYSTPSYSAPSYNYHSAPEVKDRITPSVASNKRKQPDELMLPAKRTHYEAPVYERKKVSVVYTDGASSNNGKSSARAGYGVYWGDNDPRNVSERLNGEKQTNQRAEASAVNHALEQSQNGTELLEIMTDSQYVINAATVWSKNWVEKDWKSSTGKEVQNKDLFERMLNLMETRKGPVKFTYVPGHKGVDGNEKADKLAVAGAQK